MTGLFRDVLQGVKKSDEAKPSHAPPPHPGMHLVLAQQAVNTEQGGGGILHDEYVKS